MRHVNRLLIIMSAVLLVNLTAGCSRNEQQAESADSLVYAQSGEFFSSEEGNVECMCFFDDRVYAAIAETGKSDENGKYKLVSCGLQDGESAAAIPAERLSEGWVPTQIEVLADGMLVMLMSDSKAGEQKIYVVDSLGREQCFMDVPEVFKKNEDCYAVRLLAAGENRLVLAYTDGLALIEDGDVKESLTCDGRLVDASVTRDGRIVCAVTTAGGAEAWIAKEGLRSWQDKRTFKDISYFAEDSVLADGADYDYYFQNGGSIYGFDLEAQKTVRLMNYAESGVEAGKAGSFLALQDSRFLLLEYSTGKYHCNLYQQVSAAAQAEKTVITLGMMNITPGVEKAVADFNKRNAEYRLEIKDYAAYENPQMQMQIDIAAGKAPNILGLADCDVRMMEQSGFLEDLTPYFKEDSEISLDDLLDPVREAVTTDGRINYVASGFVVSTLMAAKSDVGDIKGWTVEELLALMEKKGESSRPFYRNLKEELLGMLTYAASDNFISWKEGTAGYDTDMFRDILRVSNTGINDDTYLETDSEAKLIQKEQVYIAQVYAAGIADILAYREAFGEDVCFPGYPCDDRQGSYFLFTDQYGINAASEHKEGAWEFIKTFVSGEYQHDNVNLCFPTRKDSFAMLEESYTAQKEYEDSYGRLVQPFEGQLSFEDLTFTFGPVKKEDIALLEQMIENTHKVYSCNYSINEMISEEAAFYFSGEKSMDEVVKNIQNRIQTYVSENQ